MRGDAVRDALGVVHRTQSEPLPFTTIAGGMPGQTWCGVLFYAVEQGPESCTLPHAKPMSRAEEPVSCMTCLVRECR